LSFDAGKFGNEELPIGDAVRFFAVSLDLPDDTLPQWKILGSH
jgi:hypothetical protein